MFNKVSKFVLMNQTLLFLVLPLFFIFSCHVNTEPTTENEETTVSIITPDYYFGIDRNLFEVREHKIKRGDTFGKILEAQ
ncbi:MAG: hypothetical protein EB076_06120, partial [Flavobacteriia bacterium]|nr:hypothetical protein [Flavobacteriia bacterium]